MGKFISLHGLTRFKGWLDVAFGLVDDALATKQATLVSGTNIKTINNQSLLGSGNIEIQGGGGVEEAPQDGSRYARRDKAWVHIDPVGADLSMFGVDGEPLVRRTTANCYVIRTAGDYKIPLLYGAAVKNGIENPAAYTNEGGSHQTYFVNTYGEIINNSSIETISHRISHAEICLADENNAITNIEIANGGDCKYLYFHIPAIPTQGANILLSLFDALGNVMWTFHLWLWSQSLAPVTFINHTGVEYPLMPVNLGSKLDADLVHIKNWLYQHGRVNPMPCPAAYNSLTDHALFGVKSYGTQAAGSIANALANPQNFILRWNSNWFRDVGKTNLWDSHCTDIGASDNEVIKTVYDPCPVGWKVPAGRAFTGFTTTGEESQSKSEWNVIGAFTNGFYFKKDENDSIGQFFPAVGSRDSSTGNLYSVGNRLNVLTSAFGKIYNTAQPCSLSYYPSRLNPMQTIADSAEGMSVRPELDD